MEFKLWIAYILFWPHKHMKDLLGWWISSMPGPPPRQHKHERRYTPSTHTFIPTTRIWNDDYCGEMIFGGPCEPKVSFLQVRKNPEKPHPGNLSRLGIEHGPAAWQARMLPPVPQRWTSFYHNVVYHLIPSSTSNFLTVYHSFYSFLQEAFPF